jgi:ribosomal protein S18 acetylase RimI-like enzyme
MSAPLTIRLIEPAETNAAIALLQDLNPDVARDELARRLQAMQVDHPHYQLFGVFDGADLRGVSGCWIGTRIWCGRYLEIDNLVIDPALRNRGAGTAMIRHFENLARKEDCAVVLLDSYTNNHASHRLYHRMGFEIWGFHFVKPLRKTP